MRATASLFMVSAVGLLMACGSTAPNETRLIVGIDRTVYAAGEHVDVVFSNVGFRVVELDSCAHSIHRQQGTSWQEVRRVPPPDGACVSPPYQLAPGAHLSAAIPLPPDLAPGVYRIRFPGVGRGTEAFQVAD